MPFCLYLKNPTIQVSITCGFQSSLLRTPEDNLDRRVSRGTPELHATQSSLSSVSNRKKDLASVDRSLLSH